MTFFVNLEVAKEKKIFKLLVGLLHSDFQERNIIEVVKSLKFKIHGKNL